MRRERRAKKDKEREKLIERRDEGKRGEGDGRGEAYRKKNQQGQ